MALIFDTDKLKDLRKLRGWTLEELSEKLDVTAMSISRWERGVVEPTSKHVRRMAQVFNVGQRALYKESGSEVVA